MAEAFCATCGTAFVLTRRELYCGPQCKATANFLAATRRNLEAVDFPATAKGELARAAVRAAIRGLANSLGNDWRRPRGLGGKFLSTKDFYSTGG